MNRQARLGAFVLVGLILAGYATSRIGDFVWVKQDNHVVETEFDDLLGLDVQSPVLMAGVKIGIVQEILLRDNRAVVRIALNPDIRLPASTRASIIGRGLVGEKNLSLRAKPGDTKWLPDGATIPSDPTGDISTFIAKSSAITDDIKKLSDVIAKMFNDEDDPTSLKRLLKKTNQAIEQLNSVIKENRSDLRSTIENLHNASAALSRELPGIMKDFSKVSKKLPPAVSAGKDFFESGNDIVLDNRENIYRILFELRKSAENLEAFSDDIKRNPWKVLKEKDEIPRSKEDERKKMEELLLTTGNMGESTENR